MLNISKAEKSRTHEIDEAMESVASLLGGMRVIKALGAQPGRFMDILADLYVPNARPGRINNQSVTRLMTPSEHKNDTSIPLFLLNRGEFVVPNRDMMTLHADQRDVLDEFTKNRGTTAEVASVLPQAVQLLDVEIKNTEPLSLSTIESDDEGRQLTATTDVNVTIGSLPRIIRGRPAIYLPRTELSPRSVGLMLFHQLIHVDQALHHPPVLTTQAMSERATNEEEARKLENKLGIASLPYRMRQPE
ncbi:MAG: hypothetical protein JWN26_784 [Candidatus Saccharibacteria bacterium]|nr:hypothetical protein [Candidatus Saccharibacteria bacterium]